MVTIFDVSPLVKTRKQMSMVLVHLIQQSVWGWYWCEKLKFWLICWSISMMTHLNWLLWLWLLLPHPWKITTCICFPRAFYHLPHKSIHGTVLTSELKVEKGSLEALISCPTWANEMPSTCVTNLGILFQSSKLKFTWKMPIGGRLIGWMILHLEKVIPYSWSGGAGEKMSHWSVNVWLLHTYIALVM